MQVQTMIDERGWTPLYDYDSDGGLSLSQLHAASLQLQELLAGNPLVKRGSQLRIIYTWGGGVDFGAKAERDAKGKKKNAQLTGAVQAICDLPRNIANLFSSVGQEELERAAYTDGNVFLLSDNLTKATMTIPIKQIQGDIRNPDDHSEIWAFRRVWSSDPNANKPVFQVRWYFTDLYDDAPMPPATVAYGGKREAVDRKKTMLQLKFNSQIGWAYGVPDALAIIAWARLYKEFVLNGYVMSKALAQLAYKMTSKSAAGASGAAVQVALPGQSGSTASMVEGQQLDPLSTAGKGYDFDSGRAIAAHIASGIEVSLVALLSDSGAAKGSSSTEQTLDGPTRATAAMRRRTWQDHYSRIFRFFGNTRRLKLTWHDLPLEQIQRIMQAWVLANNTGYFEREVIQQGISEAMSIAEPGDIPDGAMYPNNTKSLPRKDIDSDGTGGGTTGAGGATAGTGQGQGDGSGSGLGNDHSTD